jgi:hypothetical protein
MNMDRKRKKQLVTGGVLAAVGLVLFFLQLSEDLGEAIVFLLLGGAFTAGYFYRRAFGLLVPGCILLGLSTGYIWSRWVPDTGHPFYIGLGIGFLAIYVIHRLYQGESTRWPLIPGLILLVIGLAHGSATFAVALRRGWPLALVVLGLLIMTGTLKMGRHKN